MTGKRKKLAMSFLLQVLWNDEASMVKKVGFPDCSSLSALTYGGLADVQKFITLRLFIVLKSVNNHWKYEKLLYVFPVYALT
jgi:hypothetical protein